MAEAGVAWAEAAEREAVAGGGSEGGGEGGGEVDAGPVDAGTDDGGLWALCAKSEEPSVCDLDELVEGRWLNTTPVVLIAANLETALFQFDDEDAIHFGEVRLV